MTDRAKYYTAFSRAAWGYVFLCFNINLGSVNILPNFVAYILFYLAIEKLSPERRDLALLKPLCVLLGAWNAADWLLRWGGGSLDGQALFLDLLAAAAGLYFQYQFLTDMAALAETYRPAEDNNLDARLRRRRTAYIVLATAISVFSTWPGRAVLRGDDWRSWVLMGLALIAMLVALMIMANLFELRKFFRPDTAADDGAA